MNIWNHFMYLCSFSMSEFIICCIRVFLYLNHFSCTLYIWNTFEMKQACLYYVYHLNLNVKASRRPNPPWKKGLADHSVSSTLFICTKSTQPVSKREAEHEERKSMKKALVASAQCWPRPSKPRVYATIMQPYPAGFWLVARVYQTFRTMHWS